MIKVSVILPSLNVGEYIDECINSVINQTLTDIEIIIVDAGSTDGTIDRINYYMKNDLRIRLIESDKKSYGYQVNLGIREANGEYIAIVDTDDYISENMYEILYNAAKEYEVEIIKCNHYKFVRYKDEYVNRIVKVFDQTRNNRYNRRLHVKSYSEIFLRDTYIWNGVYKRDFLINKCIRLNETTGAAYQDNGFLFQTLCNCDEIVYIDNALYHYRRDNENASIYSPKGMEYVYNEYQFIQNFMKSMGNESKYFYPYVYARYFSMMKFRYDTMIKMEIDIKPCMNTILKIREDLKNAYNANNLISDIFIRPTWNDIRLFIDDPIEFENKMRRSIFYRNENLDRIQNLVRNNDNVIIFGAGDKGGEIYIEMLLNQITTIKAFCDNKKNIQNTYYMDLPVFALDEAIKKYTNVLFVIANINYAYEIREQLIEHGICPDHIVTYRG